MKIIQPTIITNAMLVSSTIPEEDTYLEYNAATTYTLGSRVYVVASHLVYEAIQAVPITTPPKTPAQLEAGELDEYWFSIRATTRWLAFDQKVGSSQISSESDIVYVLSPGIFSGISLLGVQGTEVEFKLEEVSLGYEQIRTIPLTTTSGDGEVYDWYSYFFSEFSLIDDLATLGWPAFSDGTLTITIKGGGTKKLSEIIVGRTRDLGFTQYSPTFSIVDYSRKERDIFGNFIITPRGFSKKVDIRTVISNNNINRIKKVLTDIRTTPVVWIPTEIVDYQATLLVYGYYRDFSMVIPHPIFAEMNLQIEGLT